MKILHLSSEFPPQSVFGLGRYVRDLAGAQTEAGHSVEVITNSINGKEPESCEGRLKIRRVHFPPPPKAPAPSAMLLHFNLQLVERCLESRLAGTAEECDVVCAHDWLTFPAAFHLGRLLKSPVVTTIHDVIFRKVRGREFGAEDAYVAGIENWACHLSSKVVVLSQTVRAELLDCYHAPTDKIAVVPGGVGVRAVSEEEALALGAWRRRLVTDNEDLLLYVGRLDPEKGLPTLLAAALELRKTKPTGWKLALAGSGTLKETIEGFVKQNGLDSCIVLLGYLPIQELRFAYGSADVLVIPSEYEPFGLVALEGQRMGTPVIVSNTGGLAEILSVTEGGLSFEPGNHCGLAQTIAILLSDPRRRAELGARGKMRAQVAYGWNAIAKAIEDVYVQAKSVPLPENSIPPAWSLPTARIPIPGPPPPVPPGIPLAAVEKKPTAGPGGLRSPAPLCDLVVFWDLAMVSELEPLLAELERVHPLGALDGAINVLPVLTNAATVHSWSPRSGSGRVRLCSLESPGDLDRVCGNAAAAIASASLRAALTAIIDPRKLPTIWYGEPRSGSKDDWSAGSVKEAYALASKLLCDERLREQIAPQRSLRLPQIVVARVHRDRPDVLHVVPQLVTGGAETTLLDIVKATNGKFSHRILSLGSVEGPLPGEFVAADVEIVDLGKGTTGDILGFIQRSSPDLLHLHSMSYVSKWIPVHRALANMRVLETEHVVNIGSGHFGPVDTVCCVSNATRDAHRAYEGAWKDAGPSFEVVYNGIDAGRFERLPTRKGARAALNLPQDRPIIGRVSALARNKLPAEALNVIPIILELEAVSKPPKVSGSTGRCTIRGGSIGRMPHGILLRFRRSLVHG